MDRKPVNTDIRCRVESCEHHCEGKDYCSLSSISVEPCKCCATGNPADESCCGSYRHR